MRSGIGLGEVRNAEFGVSSGIGLKLTGIGPVFDLQVHGGAVMGPGGQGEFGVRGVEWWSGGVLE